MRRRSGIVEEVEMGALLWRHALRRAWLMDLTQPL